MRSLGDAIAALPHERPAATRFASVRSFSRFVALLLAFASMLALSSMLAGVSSATAQQPLSVPALGARVTDQTGTLTAAEKRELESQLADFEQRKGSQIAVLLVETTAPESIEAYTIRVAEAWKLGRGIVKGKSVDDGLLVLVAVRDRRIRIEVGYGLEGVIPDATARRIIAESISPRFRSGDYFAGLKAGLADIEARIAGESLPAPWDAGSRSDSGDSTRTDAEDAIGIVPLLLFAFVAATILSSIVGRFLGASAGGVGAGLLGYPLLGSTLLSVGAGVLVFVLVLFIAPTSRRVRRVGRHTYNDGPVHLPGGWGRGGGFGGGGLGGGGGGFSGGGGGFGGGGASGGW